MPNKKYHRPTRRRNLRHVDELFFALQGGRQEVDGTDKPTEKVLGYTAGVAMGLHMPAHISVAVQPRHVLAERAAVAADRAAEAIDNGARFIPPELWAQPTAPEPPQPQPPTF